MALNALQARLKRAFQDFAQRRGVEGQRATLSYEALDRLTAALAASLHQRHGIGPGDIVPLWLARSPVLAVAQLALIRLGAVCAPLDQASPPTRLDGILRAIRPKLVLSDRPLPDMDGPQLVIECLGDEHLSDLGNGPANADLAWWPTPPDSAAFLMFTSGSTGVPKGVLVPAAGLEVLARSGPQLHLTPDQRWAAWASPSFDAAIFELCMPLLNGGCHVVQDQAMPDLGTLAQFIQQRQITDALMTTSLFNAMVEDQLGALGQLKQLLMGGERASVQHVHQLLLRHPSVHLINAYGPTENAIVTLMHRVTLADIDAQSGVPIGLPVADNVLRVHPGPDSADGCGELWASGPGVAAGYLHDPKQTADRFVLHEGRRWYRTGDQVRQRADGVFLYVGRTDRQVKLQGHRVELDEIELRIAQCLGVREAVVVVKGDSAETRQLKVFYTCTEGQSVTPADLRQHLVMQLPAAVVPRLYVQLDQMPNLVSGKIDRALLARLGDHEQATAQERDTAWQSEHEARLAAIWQSLLPTADIHRHANFLLIGGSSLLAMRVSGLVAQQLGRQLRPLDVLLHPILADQARLLAVAPMLAADPAWVSDRSQLVPIDLTHGQRILLLASELDPTGAAYLVQVPLLLEAATAPTPIKSAFEQLARQHPMLRLQVHSNGGDWSACIGADLVGHWWCQHTAVIEAPSDMQWAPDLLTQINRPLDLARDGVMRVDVWPLHEGGWLLVWTLHHVCVDETSVGLALEDLQGALQGHARASVSSTVPALAGLEKAWTHDGRIQEKAKDLAQRFAGLTPALARPPTAGQEQPRQLPPGLSAEVFRVCRALGCTPFPLLMLAYGMALQEVFGAAHGLVCTPFSRRLDPALTDVFAYWLDVRLIEAGIRPEESIPQALRRVLSELSAAQVPQFEPVDRLIDALSTLGSASLAASLTQFGFTWRHQPARHVPIGAGQASLIRAPQISARYGLCLHVSQSRSDLDCSIEAGQQAILDGTSETVWRAFVAQLQALTRIKGGLPAPQAPLHAQPMAASGPHQDLLRQAWCRWLHIPEADVRPDSHFVLSGGSSLTAMRLGAQLQRDAGIRISLPDFLQNPTFANLCAQAQGGAQPWPEHLVLLGHQSASQFFVLIPGYGGHPEGMVKLAKQLQSRLGPDAAIVIVDLDGLCATAPVQSVLPWLESRLISLLGTLPPTRVAGLMGFSLGGLLALSVAQKAPGLSHCPVFLLDTCAPRMGSHTTARAVERFVYKAAHWVARRLRPKTTQVWDASRDLEVQTPVALYQKTPREVWQSIEDELTSLELLRTETPVHLIQATQTAYLMGLIWRRQTRGFAPASFGCWYQSDMDAAHLDLPRHFAEATADLVSRSPLLSLGKS